MPPSVIETVGELIYFKDSEGNIAGVDEVRTGAVMSVVSDPKLQALIDELQALSVAQETATTGVFFAERAKKRELSWDGLDEKSARFMADKLVALEPDKAEFCHLVCRSLRASRVVEVGTCSASRR